jgi:uncharacterized membrane protein (DUF106 family)
MLPEFLVSIPFSTFFIIGIAFTVSLITTLLNKKFVDQEKFKRWQKEINQWKADKNRANKTKDKKLAVKVKKQEAHILQIQGKMASQQMKTTLVTLVPLYLMWQVLSSFFKSVPIAYVPLGYPFITGRPYPLTFILWYLICSFFANMFISRILGVESRMGMGMGMGQQQ